MNIQLVAIIGFKNNVDKGKYWGSYEVLYKPIKIKTYYALPLLYKIHTYFCQLQQAFIVFDLNVYNIQLWMNKNKP